MVELNNTYRRNIGAWVHDWPKPGNDLIPSDNVPAVFWLSHPTNNLIENVAAGAMGQGIWIDLGDDNHHHALANKTLGEVTNNVAHSTMESARPAKNGDPKFDGGSGFFYEGGIGTIQGLRAYKNMVNFWAQESSELSIREASLADAHIGAWIRRYGIWNSIFVAHTKNVGNPKTPAELAAGRSLPSFRKNNPQMITGFMGFYSKSFSINNTFIGFTSDANFARGAFSVGNPNFDAPIFTEKTSLVGSEPFAVTQPAKQTGVPKKGAMVIDSDGTLTGTNGYREVRVGPPVVIDGSFSCKQHNVNNGIPVHVCSTRSRHVKVSDSPVSLSVDGKTFPGGHAQWLTNGRIYKVAESFPKLSPFTREGFKGEFFVLVFKCAKSPNVGKRSPRDNPVKVGSISQVTETTPSITEQRWHYDPKTQELWLRMTTGAKANSAGQLSHTGVPQPYSPHYGFDVKGCN